MRIRLAGYCIVAILLLTSYAARGSDQPTGSIAGKITDAETGEPICGASVMVVGTKFGTLTDSTGCYTIGGVAPGAYQVRLSHIDFEPVSVTHVVIKSDINTELSHTRLRKKTSKLQTEITVKCEGDQLKARDSSGMELPLSDDLRVGPPSSIDEWKGCIAGIVLDATTNKSLENVLATMVGTAHWRLTDANGKFRICGLPYGCYEVVLSCKEYRTVKVGDKCISALFTPKVRVKLQRAESGDSKKIETEAPRFGYIHGLLTDSVTGESIIGACVMVVGTEQRTMSDFDGVFRINNVDTGCCELAISHLDYKAISVPDIIVKPGGYVALWKKLTQKSAEGLDVEIIVYRQDL